MTTSADDLTLDATSFEHVVHIYDAEHQLADRVVGFLRPAVDAQAALVVATPAHRLMLEDALRAGGVDVDAMWAQGRYVAVDAEQTLASFFVDGEVVPALYDTVVGELVRGLAARFGRVHIYGEMVACLWGRGDSRAAIALERCWNELGRQGSFRLCCAYSASTLGEGAAGDIDDMFDTHGHVTAG
jgi:hypothetical protein